MEKTMLMTKERYKALKSFFNRDIVPLYAEFKIDGNKIEIEKTLTNGKIQYWVSVNDKYINPLKEEAKLFNFLKKVKMYKKSNAEVLKFFIKTQGKRKGTLAAEEFIKKHTQEFYIYFTGSYSKVEEMLKRHNEVYFIKTIG